MTDTEVTLPEDPQAYVEQVMAEIAEEVRLRRASGDLPPKLERELDELFLAHSPVAGRGGDLGDALRMVDAATFIDPVVPVESERAAGAVVKKGMRSLLLWYVGWLTHQMSQSASAVSRALHIVDDRLQELERQVEGQRVPAAGVVEFPGLQRADAWWVEPAIAAVAKVPGRVLHAACGDGWLVRRIIAAGGDAYGVDPRSRLIDTAMLGTLDLRGEPVGEHLRAVAAAGLGAVVLSGTVDGMAGAERGQLLGAIGTRLAPGGTLIVHSVTRQAWEAADAPPEADLAAGRPLRPEAWCSLLDQGGYEAVALSGPGRPGLPRHRGPGRRHLAVRASGAVSAAAGGPVAVHQFIATLNPHDATATHTLQLRAALRAAGWRSEIFAEAIHDDLAAEAFKHWMYPEHAAPGDVAIYQFTTSSAVAGYLAERGLPLILDFHNFTGPEYFAGWEPRSVRRAAAAADELALLAPAALLGLAKSPFSRQELSRAGCRHTVVVPVLADYRRVTEVPDARVAAELARLQAGGGADILFVGRIVPSKAQHELVKALWAYRRLYDGQARLHLVGGTSSFEYTKALQDFVDDLGLSAAVRLPGQVSDAALAAYFGAADVYLSLSAHEGFGVPLVEAMVAGVPVVTRGAGAVSDTVADAALVLAAADPSYVAAAVHRVCTDEQLRATLTAAGARRAAELSGDAAAGIIEAVAAVVGRP